jgi:ribosomal protein L27
VFEGGKKRHDRLVRNGRIVERQRPGEKPVAGNAVGVRGVSADQNGQRHHCYRQPPRQHDCAP